MSDEVEEAEAQAIRDAIAPVSPARAVEPRDFRRPRRLSPSRLRRLRRAATAAMPSAVAALATPLRRSYRLTVGAVAEVDTRGLVDGLEAPFLAYGFECGGGTGWLVWDLCAATAACEAVLSGASTESSGEPRPLSRTERRVTETLLAKLVAPITTALGVRSAPGRVAQEPDEASALDVEGPEADPRRLSVHLAFDGPGGPSDLALYLPGVDTEEPDAPEHLAAAPEHLDAVPFAVSARLGSVDVALADLLALEVGDVIPLGVAKGSPVTLHVGEHVCARARWGRHEGRLATRIEEVSLPPGLTRNDD